MKTTWIGVVSLAFAMGFLSFPAGASPLLVVGVELAPGQTGQVTVSEPNVLLNVWAYLAGKNGSASDDGVMQLYGRLMSGNGGLLGDLSFTLNASGVASDGAQHGGFNSLPTIASPGKMQDLDGDGDLDVGDSLMDYVAGDANYRNWIHPLSSLGTYMPTTDGNRVLVGTAIFTLSDPDVTSGKTTTVNWSYRIKKTGAENIDGFTVDGKAYLLHGDSNQIGTGPDALITSGEGVTITWGAVPEPGVLAVLAMGGVGLLRRRVLRR
jgi:hypothetical protein